MSDDDYTVDSRGLSALVGTTLSSPEPLVVTQQMVQMFAELTGADHWMHVDVQRAAAGPLGRTTAQGYLTLSLGTVLERQVLHVRAATAMLMGMDRVRFPAPMFVGEPLWLQIDVTAVDDDGDIAIGHYVFRYRSSGEKPVCVAEQRRRYTHLSQETS